MRMGTAIRSSIKYKNMSGSRFLPKGGHAFVYISLARRVYVPVMCVFSDNSLIFSVMFSFSGVLQKKKSLVFCSHRRKSAGGIRLQIFRIFMLNKLKTPQNAAIIERIEKYREQVYADWNLSDKEMQNIDIELARRNVVRSFAGMPFNFILRLGESDLNYIRDHGKLDNYHP